MCCCRIVARFLEWFARRLFKVEIQVERAQFLALGSIKITTAGTRIVSEKVAEQLCSNILGLYMGGGAYIWMTFDVSN